MTSDELWEYNVLPFSLYSAPATFQRGMNSVTTGLPGVSAYLDDFQVVVCITWEEHQTQLQRLFNCLSEYHFTVNLVKVNLVMPRSLSLAVWWARGRLLQLLLKMSP